MSETPDGRPWEEQPRWRHDFPIDEPRDSYVARRDFLRFLVLISGAFVLGQLWIGIKALFGRGRPPRRKIARLAAIPAGGALAFRYPGEADPCLLLRSREGELVAFSQRCTHLACAVQPQLVQGRLRCPCHAAYFDASSGRPTSGPARRPLPEVELELIGGEVWAIGVKERV